MSINLHEPDDNVIVLIKHENIFDWYVSEKELWVLDAKKLGEDFKIKLKKLGKDIEVDIIDEEREELEILDESNIKVFKQRMKKYKVTYDELEKFFNSHLEELYYRNANEICPDFYIDFDGKIFYSYYTEPNSYEYYVPKGWKGIRDNKIDKDILARAKYV